MMLFKNKNNIYNIKYDVNNDSSKSVTVIIFHSKSVTVVRGLNNNDDYSGGDDDKSTQR